MSKTSLSLRLNHLHHALVQMDLAMTDLEFHSKSVTTEDGANYVRDKVKAYEFSREWLENEILVCEIGLGVDDGAA